MNKRGFITTVLFLGVLASQTVVGQTKVDNVFEHPVTQRNQRPFSAVVKRLQLQKELRKEFAQEKRIAALKRPLVSKGTLVLSPDGICFATSFPFSSAVKITLQGIWQKVGSEKTTLKRSKDHFEIKHTAKILIALFSADKSVLENKFQLFYQQKDDQFQIGLRPKDKILSRIISNIVIEGSQEIRRIAIREANGDETTITISNDAPLKNVTLASCTD